jgi:hypothetical protein
LAGPPNAIVSLCSNIDTHSDPVIVGAANATRLEKEMPSSFCFMRSGLQEMTISFQPRKAKGINVDHVEGNAGQYAD